MWARIGVYAFIILMLGICGLLFTWVATSLIVPGPTSQNALTGAATGGTSSSATSLFNEHPFLFLVIVVFLPLGLLFVGIGAAQARGFF